jgi:hypothetical protein
MKQVVIALSMFFGVVCSLALTRCNEDPSPDPVTNLECEDLVAEIYDECELTLPMHHGDYPSRFQARVYCRENEIYDWACIDECVFDEKGLCTSLRLCLEDCPFLE